MSEDVIAINFDQWPYAIITSSNKTIPALSVVIATGSSPRTLEIPGEKLYWGKGVTTCAICDAAFHKDKEVIVIGGGDSAVEQVLQLSPYAIKIYLVVLAGSLRASSEMQNHLKSIS